MLKFRQNTLGPRFVVVRVTYNESITGRNPNCTAQRKTAGVGPAVWILWGAVMRVV